MLGKLLEFYRLDMQARGRGDESAASVDYTRRSIEAVALELLDKPVSRTPTGRCSLFRNARARGGKAASIAANGSRAG